MLSGGLSDALAWAGKVAQAGPNKVCNNSQVREDNNDTASDKAALPCPRSMHTNVRAKQHCHQQQRS